MAQVALPAPVPPAKVVQNSPTVVQPGTAAPNEPPAKPKPRPPAHYLLAALIARIYEVFPLICANCGRQIRIIAFITSSADIHGILNHVGVAPEAPRIKPGRGLPLWDACGAQELQELGDCVDALPDRDLVKRLPPDHTDDQRITW